LRILLLLAFAVFAIFGTLPRAGMAETMDHGFDCATCEDHDRVMEHEQCPHMAICALAMLPELPTSKGPIDLAETHLVLPMVVSGLDVSLSCDLPPPRG
jgi:hypothetical protein